MGAECSLYFAPLCLLIWCTLRHKTAAIAILLTLKHFAMPTTDVETMPITAIQPHLPGLDTIPGTAFFRGQVLRVSLLLNIAF